MISVPKARVDYAKGIQSVRKDEIVIKRDRLAELESKERAHDDYLYATRVMGQKVREKVAPTVNLTDDFYQLGYQQAVTDFCQLVVDAHRMRNDPS